MNRIAGSVEVEITTKQDAETLLEDFKRDIIQTLVLEHRTSASTPYRVNLIFEAENVHYA